MTGQQTVLSGMPAAGNHNTRTLEFGADDNWMYVSIGSKDNIDTDTTRSRVIRVDLTNTLPITYGGNSTQIFADGCRNEVGLRMDPFNRLWGVENGLDNLPRFMPDNDYHETNPAEEVNIFTQENAGKAYGYPYCWSEGIGENGAQYSFPDGMGNGTLWATQNPTTSSTITDEWCRTKTIGPVWAMQAHTAPLDIRFDTSSQIVPSPGVAAVIALHGSWDRNTAAGARVDYLTLDSEYRPTALTHLVEFPTTSYSTRPVAIARAVCKSHGSCLFVTDDTGNKIFVIARTDSTPSTGTPAAAPVAAPVIAASPNIINVSDTLTVQWELTDDGNSVWTSLTNTGARGWFSFAWNGNGRMGGSAILVLDGTFGGVGQDAAQNVSDYIGYVSLAQRDSNSILSSWNNPTYDWGYTNFTASQVGTTQSLSFTRPLKCASTAGSDCYDIPTDGTPANLIFAYQQNMIGYLGNKTLDRHTDHSTYAVTFPTNVSPDSTPAGSPLSPPSLDEPNGGSGRMETGLLCTALLALVLALVITF